MNGLRLIFDSTRNTFQLWYGSTCLLEIDDLDVDFVMRIE